jgi:hypothetical protein
LPCSQRIERWNGESSRQLSEDTTYQPGLWTESSTSFWHSLRATRQYCSMLRLLMTCAIMLDIMQIRTRRRETGSGGGSALSSVTVSTPSGPTATMSWSARQAEKKRKTPVAGPSAQPQRFRIVSDTQNRGPQQQQGRWVIQPQQQQQQAPNHTQFPAQRNNQQQQQYRQANDNRCFTCGNTGHYAKNCPRNQPRQGQNISQNQGKRQKVQVR